MKMTDDQVTAYLGHVRALIGTAHSKPGDAETEHAMVTDLFPGFVAAVEAALGLAVEWKQIPFDVRASDECADELREAITAALAGKEAGHG